MCGAAGRAQLQGQHSHKEALFPLPRVYVNGASHSCAVQCCGGVRVPGDGVLVRTSGEGEMLKSGVVGKELRGVGSAAREESSVSMKEGNVRKLFFSLSST